MSILSTDKKLISFGTDYSAGSGISIIDHTISIVPSAVGKVYSAGPNIGIYDVSGQPTISSKDWTQDIDQSSSGAVTESISYFNDWINGQYTEDISNVTNNLTALSGDLSSYYKKTETSSKAEISAALDYVSAHAVGDVEVNNYVHNNSATIDEVNSAYQSNSATWNETSNVVSSNSAQWSEGKTYEGISPIVVNNRENKVSADTWTLTAGDGISFVENSANKVTRIDCTAQGGDPEVQNLVRSNSSTWDSVTNKLDTTAFSQVSGDFLTTAFGIPESGVWNDTSNVVQTNSAQWAEGGMDEEVNSFVRNNSATINEVNTTYQANSGSYQPAGNYIPYTAVNADITSSFKTNSGLEINTYENGGLNSTVMTPRTIQLRYRDLSFHQGSVLSNSNLKFENTNDSAYVDMEKIHTWDIASNYIQNNSATLNEVSAKVDTTAFSTVSGVWNDTSNVVQTNSAQWAQGGGSVSSKYGTITVDGSDIEATNKALEFKSNGFTSSFDYISLDEDNSPQSIAWDNYSEGTTLTLMVMNMSDGDTLTYSSNTNITGLITAPKFTPTDVSLSLPNATAVQFSANHRYDLQNIEVTAASSFQVNELAWKSDLPTYEYDRNRRVSAINGNALVGNEDYILEKGFVQNLTSPNETIIVKNNKIEGTNSAIKSDTLIEGFVSAYDVQWVYPGNSATLTWDRYVPNAKLYISGDIAPRDYTLTYSANTNVTGTITVPEDEQVVSVELPTDSTSIVIGEGTDYRRYNFTVSAKDYYEVGELAWASALPTYEYDSSNKISAINGSALAGGSEFPASANEAITTYQNNSATYLTAHQAISANEWNSNYETVNTNSGVWGGSALPISAGNGINLSMVDGVLVISLA